MLPLLHVDEPEPDWLDLASESAGSLGVGLGLDLVERVVGLGDVVVAVGVEGAVGVWVEVLDAATTLGFLAFLLLIFSSSSDDGHGEIDTRPTLALADLFCLAAAFLLSTELALNEGARFSDCGLSKGGPQNESERRMRWTRGSGGCIC